MTVLDADAFLTQLTRILESSKTAGTVYVTMKRYVPPEGKGPPDADREPRCLVRTVGAKRKISAMVAAKDYRRFMQSYGNILKVSLDSLKKKEKVKKTINKAEKKETGAKSS
ncbi:signal recognition particle 14kda (homologous alu RNA binding protein) [Chrysochromulina tobinii]|uniref:Signal recognition particle 14 kDa protein n=1 Tax=Chrysochromulina tobinii TaxID=1460289 RepID=A0A0M0J9I3_9EUKA|nr:signal recognition particle 14kda (homologous alu RNA binding protein) [Chrysochromulina tobinii]|eukprot:KOO22987.1 signal recognition particle 14kda (homologous alu RNA binding protein) [Chrysochromulina sp. CCMP291]